MVQVCVCMLVCVGVCVLVCVWSTNHICRPTAQCEPVLMFGATLSQAQADWAAADSGMWSETHIHATMSEGSHSIGCLLNYRYRTGQTAWQRTGLKLKSSRCSFLSFSLCSSLLFLCFRRSLYIFHSPPLLVFCLAVWCTDDMMIVFSMLVDSWQKEVGESGGKACLLLLIICEATLVYQHGTQAGMEGPREGGRINVVLMSANISISSFKWSHSLWLPSLYLFNFLVLIFLLFTPLCFVFFLQKEFLPPQRSLLWWWTVAWHTCRILSVRSMLNTGSICR